MGYIEVKNNANENNNRYYTDNTNIISTLVDCTIDLCILTGKLSYKFIRWCFDGWFPIEENKKNFNILWKELRLYNQIGNMPIEKDVNIGSKSDFYSFTIPTGMSLNDFEKKRKEIAQFLHEDIRDVKIELINNLACITVNKLKDISFNYENYKFKNNKYLSIPLGINLKNYEVMYWNPNDPNTPHLLIAGNTGGGKSTLLYVILSYIVQYRSDVDLYIQDVKFVDLPIFENLAIRYNEGTHYATETLKELVDIMNERYKYIKSFGKRCANELDEKNKLNSIVYVLEELNAFNPKKDNEFFRYLGELLSRGRAANISVITVTQSPYSTILPGDLKNNYPAIIGLRTGTSEASKVICGQYEKLNYLKGEGHGYFFGPKGEVEFKGFNIQLKTIEKIVSNHKR